MTKQPGCLPRESGLSQLKYILEQFPDGVFTLDQALSITYVNPAFCELIGYDGAELIGSQITDHLGDLNILEACHAEVSSSGVCRDQETTFKRKDGTLVNISKNVQMLQDEQGKVAFVVSIRDLSQVHALNKKLAESTRKLEDYNQNLSEMVLRRTRSLNEQMAFLSSYKKALDSSNLVSKFGLDQQVTEVNQALCERSGYGPDELTDQPYDLLWSEESKSLIDEINTRTLSGGVWKGRVSIVDKYDMPLYLETCIVPICSDSGEVCELVNISHDVTPLVESTDILRRRLDYDNLTELPNRNRLLSDMEKSDGRVLIALLNIDSFSEINTFYGHQVADQLLNYIAKRLVQSVSGLSIQFYKLPVDEYALVIQCDWNDDKFNKFVVELMEKVASRPFVIGGEEINVTLTAGLASSETASGEPKEVLIAADMALKMAKKEHKMFVFYDPGLNIKQGYEDNISWVKRLRSALSEDRLIPFYQPIVNTRTLEVERYECLVRIIEGNNVISPFHFLDIAKRLKLYSQLTKRVVDKAFEKFADQSCKFSINLSIEDIVDPAMSDWIIKKVGCCDFAERVIFEIVESEGITNYEEVNRFIKEVKRFGVQIAIDDFGAGYSNFAYMMSLDIDFIKIDGSIIRNIHQNRSSQVITETILDFASKLNIQTVAEFVADETVYDYVKHLPVDSLQGFLFGEPRPQLFCEMGQEARQATG